MASSMPRAIVDLDDFVESHNIMIYGDTGSGKTEQVGYLPGKVLILSSENGTVVIKRMMKRLGIGKAEAKRFKVWPIRKWDDLEDAYNWCEANQDKFDWIVIDSATSVQQRAMRAAMKKAVERNPEKRDIDLPDRGEHQKMQNAMKRMIADFNELSTNVLWLAQAMRREDRDGNEIVVPFIMGKDYEVSAWACAQMQAFGCLIKRPKKVGKQNVTERVLLWDSFADGEVNYWSKDRYQVFPRFCVLATGDDQKMNLGDLIQMINDDPEASARARRAVDTRDEPEPDEDEEYDDTDDESGAIGGVSADDDEVEQRRAELANCTKKQLGEIANEYGMDLKALRGKSIDEIIQAIIDEEMDGEDDAADEVDDDAEDEFGEEEPEEVTARREELMAMTPKALKAAVTEAGLDLSELKGKSREEGVEIILQAEFFSEDEEGDAADDDDDDELDLEGMALEEEEEPVKPKAKKASNRRFRAAEED